MGAAQIHSNGNNLAVIDSTSARVPAVAGGAHHNAPNDSILEIVWRQRNIVLACVGAFFLLAVLYLLVATRYYSGYARLYVQQAGTKILNEESRPPEEIETFLYTQREMIQSTPVIAMALATPGVRDLKTFDGEDNLFSYLKKNLTVEVGKKDELISLQFDTPYRDDAQKIVAAMVDSYINYQSKQRHTSASEVISVLQQESEKRTAELHRKQDELQALRQAAGIYSATDEKTNLAKQQLELIVSELTKAQTERIAAKTAWEDIQRSVLADPARKAAFDKARATAGYSAPTAIDDAQIRARMLQQQELLQQMLASGHYGTSHPAIRRVQWAIDQDNIFYALAVARRFETAQQKEADLQKSFDDQQKLAIGQNARAMEEARLENEVKRLEGLAAQLDTRLKEVGVTQGASAPSITVLEPATASKSPTRPYFLRTLALALLAGGVFGCVAACIRDWYDYRLRSADEVKASLGVTVLGLIPHVGDENSPIARGQKIHVDPNSEVAEAYRALRTAVYFGTRETKARSILVTSPERGDGKSTMTSNLAISIAQMSRRVLLIDADLRAPMQDLIFGINGRTGLATVLQGKATVESAIRHTGIENLDLLPAGVAARNPSELLNSNQFIELIEKLGEQYDQVIIDSPPMLAVTDARIIAASADATLLVLRAGKSNRKLGELSIDGLVSVGAKLLGAVVNDIQRRSYRAYGSYGRYGYGDNGRQERGAVMTEADVNGNGNGNGNYSVMVDDESTSLATRARL